MADEGIPLGKIPVLEEIVVPDFPGAYAIWGAIGADSAGHVWFAVSAEGVDCPSAHLFEYDPSTGERPVDRGDVVTALKRAGKQGEGGRRKVLRVRARPGLRNLR